MPGILKRSRRRELSVTKSFVNAVKSKVASVESIFGAKPLSHYNTRQPIAHSYHIDPFKTDYDHAQEVPRRVRRWVRRPHYIHSLPPELLSHIFALGSQMDTMLPVDISHVCRAWRYIALHTPPLWRRISLDLRTDMWAERMYRAKACTFDIELRSDGAPCRVLDVNSVSWCMHLVAPYIYRWRSLDISFNHYSPWLWNAALSGCCGHTSRVHAPLIQDISLVYPHNDDTKEYTLFDGVAPRLTRVTLYGLRLTWLPSLFGNLTHLDYTHHGFTRGLLAVSELIEMLQVSYALRELRLEFPAATRDVPSSSHPLRPVILPWLAHLHFRVSSRDIPSELYHFSSIVSTPSLLSLQLLDVTRCPRPFARLHSFLPVLPLPPSLIALRIENGWYEPYVVGALIRRLPNVQQLVVKDPLAPERLFVDMRARRGRQVRAGGWEGH
ncbi:hypothetical protein PLICRDRAFT_494663 [Plicaturopsis crispa FD-325 SS-3]|uniref:Unplaced genomic scaffold PLICRscaffold_34, whole genome shotgun sequence n=1 Tax=Plicaturopsis crispa FD-325 SS-3 TaxID=944288 RepID=A0A0C9SK31_PLICR|nr:hypothetical protein PLICRDRAFT_494663 [Plicaturopsis crispa FD-325 SS-3]